MSEHIPTKVVPTAQAKIILAQLQAEVTEIVARYDLHGFIYSASVSEDEVSGSGGAVSTGSVYGCIPHSLAFMARFIGTLSYEDLSNFLGYIASIAAARTQTTVEAAFAEALAEETPHPTVDDNSLLKMPLPKGQKWQN